MEFYFQVVLVVFIVGVVVWMLWCMWCDQYGYGYYYDYEEVWCVDIGYGCVRFEVFEIGVLLCFWFYIEMGYVWVVYEVEIMIICFDGVCQDFCFFVGDGFLEFIDEIFEFYEFLVWLSLGYEGYCYDYDLVFSEYVYGYVYEGFVVGEFDVQDVYVCVYVNDIKCWFVNCKVMIGQIIIFGFIGGFIFCFVFIIVLLLCL